MPKKVSKPPASKSSARKRPQVQDTEAQRPPESAEDFEHVLRRLVARRNREAGEAASS
jgi:hypothetical protein